MLVFGVGLAGLLVNCGADKQKQKAGSYLDEAGRRDSDPPLAHTWEQR